MKDQSYPHNSQHLEELNENLAQQLTVAEEMVRRSYIGRLGECDIVPFGEMGAPIADNKTTRISLISRLVYDKKESALENLLNIYTAVGTAGYGLVMVVKSDGKIAELCIGVRSDNEQLPAESGKKILQQAIDGHLSGSKYKHLRQDQIFNHDAKNEDRASLLLDLDYYTERNPTWAISALAGIPSLKTEEREVFTQGLERFIDAMQGLSYTAVLLADPVMPQRCATIERGYEQLASALSGLVKQQVSLGMNESKSISHTVTEGVAETISESVALSQSHTEGTSWSQTKGTNESTTRNWGGLAAAVLGVAIGAAVGGPVGAVAGAAVGQVVSTLIGSKTNGSSTSDQQGSNKAETDGKTDTIGISEGQSLSVADATTSGKGTSRSISFETQNKSIARIIDKIDQQLKRIDEARAYGLWNAACYFLCDSRESAQTAASLFSGCIRGKDSGVEDSAIIIWSKPITDDKADSRDSVREYVQNLCHPRLRLSADETIPLVCPSAILTGKELALLMHMPRRSVGGVTVVDTTGFGRDVHRLVIGDEAAKEADWKPGNAKDQSKRTPIVLGKIRHLFKDQATEVAIDIDKLVYHTLVTGTTGAGKTTGVKALLMKCHQQDIQFLVLEPAKDEYKELINLATQKKPVRRLQAGRPGADCLRLNPLVFPEGAAVSLVEHIDRVCALFNAAFPMYAAMPQLLEEAIVQAYEQKGWDTLLSQCRGGKRVFPTLREVADLVPLIVERAGYRQEAQSTYVGALTTRLRSLMRGVLGFTFMAQESEETSGSKLFDESCIVNVSFVGSTEKRAVLMGLLMIRLQEHRAIQGPQGKDCLRHLMVVEEAHNILKRTSPHANMESSNPQAQAVEYFANALAEMRAFGEGFVIVDQSASALDDAVLKNTNTKIAFRAPFEGDRNILGGSLALDEKQTRVLATLENHTAVVKQNDWLEAVCCHFHKADITQTAPTEVRRSAEELREQGNNKACLTTVLAGLFSGRINVPRTPDSAIPDSKTLTQWLMGNVKIESYRKQIEEQLETHQSRELTDIRPLLLSIAPMTGIFRNAELCATEDGVITHLLLSLEAATGIVEEQTLVSLAHDCLRCVEQRGLLDQAAELIESTYDLRRRL